jgi:magnesium chelatase family protein
MARTHALSARALVRIRRLARTIADLEGSADVRHEDLAEGLTYRIRTGT